MVQNSTYHVSEVSCGRELLATTKEKRTPLKEKRTPVKEKH